MREFSLNRALIFAWTFSRIPVLDNSICWKTSASRKMDSVATVARTVAERFDCPSRPISPT
jgi:hypothetical protein